MDIHFQHTGKFLPDVDGGTLTIKTLIAVERHRKDKKSNSVDTAWYVTSNDIDPEFMSTSICQCWRIENRLYWVLDVVYKEDDCRVHDENSAKALSFIRKVVLNLAKMETMQDRSMKSKIQCALMDDDYRELILFG